MFGWVYQWYLGDIVCDYYYFWEQDFDLIQVFGVDVYWFLIVWFWILLNGCGLINEKGLDFYDWLIDGLVECGLKVYLIFYYWDLLLVVVGDGGWIVWFMVDVFVDYIEIVVRCLGDWMDVFVIINEFWCICYLSYFYGIYVLGEKNEDVFVVSVYVFNLVYGKSVQVVCFVCFDLFMGLVLNVYLIYLVSDVFEDKVVVDCVFLFYNDIFMFLVFNGCYDLEIIDVFGDKMLIEDGDLEIIS